MVRVERRSDKETTSSLLRRFNRRVGQSGVLMITKRRQYFEKPMTKRDRRLAAIKRRQRRVANRLRFSGSSPQRRGRPPSRISRPS